MKLRLSFIIKNNKKQKELSWLSVSDEDVWPGFSEALLELWPGEKLPSPGNLSFLGNEEGIELRCKKALVINGVSVNSRLLKEGDRIILGPLRLFFRDFERVKEADVPEQTAEFKTSSQKFSGRNVLKLLPAAVFLSAMAVAGIIAGCMTAPKSTMPASAGAPDRTAFETRPVQPDIKTAVPAAVHQNLYSRPELPEDSDAPVVVVPGAAVPEIDLDILFIHAHPDDESLDFGSLMALADSAGLKTGLVTFTDGESGLDLYPDRPTAGTYPDHYLKPDELAEVRSGEVEKAAGILGVDLLIRLGLKNHPYNSLNDEIPPEEILNKWGGRDALTAKLLEILEKTSPETVVAPDVPGLAREHFEHEAVGYLAAGLMSGLSREESGAPERFITCIDPRQKDIYPEGSAVFAGKIIKDKNSDGYSSLREVQIKALMMHKTQNDAVNVGTGFLPEYPSEYYQVQFWRSEQSWEEWINALGE